LSSEIYFEYIKTNGVTLHTARAGDNNKPLVILLHGFPEYWQSWRYQIQALVTSGYQIMAPDQRGYNLSSKPWRIGSYKIDKLAEDIIGLIDYSNQEKAYIIGHDWGAAVTWHIGMVYPDRVHKIVTINVPHSSVMRRFIRTDPEQKKKSSYMFFFQLPLIPQYSLKRKNFRRLRAALEKTSIEGTFTEHDFEKYIKVWKQRREVSCMLNWYRAAIRRRVKIQQKRITVPIMIMWGENDQFLKKEMAKASLDFCDQGKLEYIRGATHWVHHEFPEEVNNLLIDFLS
jgi:pimeloyl-ACP methyl ester carboxylesterase